MRKSLPATTTPLAMENSVLGGTPVATALPAPRLRRPRSAVQTYERCPSCMATRALRNTAGASGSDRKPGALIPICPAFVNHPGVAATADMLWCRHLPLTMQWQHAAPGRMDSAYSGRPWLSHPHGNPRPQHRFDRGVNQCAAEILQLQRVQLLRLNIQPRRRLSVLHDLRASAFHRVGNRREAGCVRHLTSL